MKSATKNAATYCLLDAVQMNKIKDGGYVTIIKDGKEIII